MVSEVFCMDCMEYMRTMPDKFFDLAIVDPPYGIGRSCMGEKKKWKSYKPKDWDKSSPDRRYFEELFYNPQIQISAESETKRSIFREKDKTKRSKKESAQHSKSRNKSFVMTSVSAL